MNNLHGACLSRNREVGQRDRESPLVLERDGRTRRLLLRLRRRLLRLPLFFRRRDGAARRRLRSQRARRASRGTGDARTRSGHRLSGALGRALRCAHHVLIPLLASSTARTASSRLGARAFGRARARRLRRPGRGVVLVQKPRRRAREVLLSNFGQPKRRVARLVVELAVGEHQLHVFLESEAILVRVASQLVDNGGEVHRLLDDGRIVGQVVSDRVHGQREHHTPLACQAAQ